MTWEGMPPRSSQYGRIDAEDIHATSVALGGTTVTSTAAELNGLDASVVGGTIKIKKIAITTTPTGAEQDTGFDLPAKAVLLDVWVDVTTAEATGGTKTIDVGTKVGESGGDPDGFIDGASVATIAVVRGGYGFTTDHYSAGTRGVLLAQLVAGAGTDDRGLYSEKPYMTGSLTAKSVVYTAGSNDFAEFRGAIYLMYMEIA